MTRGLVVAGLLALGVVACRDDCDELEDQCTNCPANDNETRSIEMMCQVLVDADDDDACERALELLVCP